MIVSVILLLLLCAIYLKNYLKTVMIAMKLSGPKGSLFFGNVKSFTTQELFDYGRKDYGKVFFGWMFVIPVMCTFDAKVNQLILGSSKHTDKSFFYSFINSIVGEGLITSNGPKWKLHRKLIQPYFRKSVLDQFALTFFENSRITAEKIKGNDRVNVTTYVNETILNIQRETILGLSKEDVQRHEDLKESPFRKGQSLLIFRILRPWYMFDYFFRKSKLSENEINKKYDMKMYIQRVLDLRRQGKITGGNCKSLMEMFVEISNKNSEFGDDEIIDEISTFMLAGQDSVGGTLAFALYFLAKNEEIQNKARQEIDRVFTKDTEFLSNYLDEMKYLEQCIKETLRILPTIPIISRTLTEELEIDNMIYPKGTLFLLSPYGTHRREDNYRDPEKFDPDRFELENEHKLPPFSYIPFSAGPRNCIGYKFALMEVKTFLAIILKNYVLSVPPDYNLLLSYRVTLRAKGGIWINFTPRSKLIN